MNSMLLIARNNNPFLLNIDVCRASDSDLDRWHTWDSSFHLDDIEFYMTHELSEPFLRGNPQSYSLNHYNRHKPNRIRML